MSFYQLARPEMIKAASRYLALFAALAAVFFLWECFFHSTKKDFEQMVMEYRRVVPVPATVEKTNEKIDMIAYEEIINQKSIFKLASAIQAPEIDAPDGLNAAADPFQNVALVGILPGDFPQAIFEDAMTQQNHYLSVVEAWNNIEVEKIQDGAVILTSGTHKKKFTL
jgi:hypothetical protein